jgi:hypothetical protein
VDAVTTVSGILPEARVDQAHGQLEGALAAPAFDHGVPFSMSTACPSSISGSA